MNLSKALSAVKSKLTNKSSTIEEEVEQKYTFTDEDRLRSLQERRLKAEIRKQKSIREAYIQKLLDDREIATIKSEISDLENDEAGMEEKLLMSILGPAFGGNPLNPTATAPQQDLNNFEKDLNNKTLNEIQEDEIPEQVIDEKEVEKLKKQIPKLLNEQQIQVIKNLPDEELDKILAIIKKDL